MHINSVRLNIEVSDIVARFVFDRRLDKSVTDEMAKNMDDFVELAEHKEESALFTAFIYAYKNLPSAYAVFGDMLEVRYNDALKSIELN